MDQKKSFFSEEEIILEPNQISNFPLFKNSHTLTKFLKYCYRIIQKREQYLKQYTIAVNVLERFSNFSSHNDAAVHIHATRLRSALNEYYLTQKNKDSIIIFIPNSYYSP